MSKCNFFFFFFDVATWYLFKLDDFVVPDVTVNKICNDNCENCKLNGGYEDPKTYQLH